VTVGTRKKIFCERAEAEKKGKEGEKRGEGIREEGGKRELRMKVVKGENVCDAQYYFPRLACFSFSLINVARHSL
jgi:hypothetical protein